ncbi:DUF2971 domain-containing protein [Atlantibacter hermannii]|uniref:DUF2971 domain-containing protein n=1 Tax=Atlantibacter hermannii TaxID=565 RepID=UPI00289C244F|nr:DUF2971 domain-containing protein [Atlantibacter hermannii]
MEKIEMKRGFYFYKYVSKEVAISIISNGTLMFSNPLKFNDPFDIAPTFPVLGRSKNYKMVLSHHGIKPKAYGKEKKRVIEKINAEDMRNGLLKDWSVTCFSKSPFILPLWAHYAENHTGCVLEFKVTEEVNRFIETRSEQSYLQSDILYPLPVCYSQKRPVGYDANGNVTEQIALNMMLTKDTAWSYEQEMRCFKSGVAGLYPFRKDQLHRVYCGLKLEDTCLEEIRSVINEYKNKHSVQIKLDRVHLDRDEFKMTKL